MGKLFALVSEFVYVWFNENVEKEQLDLDDLHDDRRLHEFPLGQGRRNLSAISFEKRFLRETHSSFFLHSYW